MQNQDSVSVQRRIPDVEDYIDILRRHRSWILGPAMIGLVAGVVTAFLWPDTFVSDATVRVVPPQVPERYVPANVTAQVSDRFNAMAQSILSRNTLTTIIQTYNLYPEARSRRPMEDILEDMRKDLNVYPVNPSGAAQRRNAVAFRVSFEYSNRFLAQKVTNDVVGRLIDEYTRSRSSQANQTTDFLQDKVEQAKRELDEIDKKITEFRFRNVGQTPDQKSLNIQQLNAFELRMATINSSMSRVNQEKMMLEGDLRTLQEKVKLLSAIPAPSQAIAQSRNEGLAAIDRQISQRETVLAALQERYTDTHPEVKRVRADIGVLRKSREAIVARQDEAAQKPAQGQPVRVDAQTAREILETQGQIARKQGEIQGKDFQLEELAKEMASLNRATKQYQMRIESSPAGEQQYMQLMLDRQAASAAYEDLSRKMNSSEIATDLENRKQGETLEILDEASLPVTPTEPRRATIILAGVLGGFILGAVFAGGREMKDTSLKNLKDVRAYTNLTLLGSVPLLENDLVVRRRRRLTWLAWSVASILSILIMAASVYYYHFVVKV